MNLNSIYEIIKRCFNNNENKPKYNIIFFSRDRFAFDC